MIVISGFSGVGKGTLVKALMEKYDSYALSVSVTTRTPRKDEREGVEYFYKTGEEFEQMISEDAFIEYAQYVDCSYGTPKAYVEQQLARGKDVILEIEMQGAMKVKERFPDTRLLFVTTKDFGTLKERLIGRDTESEEKILARLRKSLEESKGIEKYDYLIINECLEEAVEETHAVIQAEHFRADKNLALIEDLRHDMKLYLKGEY